MRWTMKNKGVLGHLLDEPGTYILAWKWEFQKQYGCEGWTYYGHYETKEEAEHTLETYVSTNTLYNSIYLDGYNILRYDGLFLMMVYITQSSLKCNK